MFILACTARSDGTFPSCVPTAKILGDEVEALVDHPEESSHSEGAQPAICRVGAVGIQEVDELPRRSTSGLVPRMLSDFQFG